MTTAHCPFCGSEISAAQLGQMRDKIRKGQDPAILREVDELRQVIRTQEQEKAQIEVGAIRTKLTEYQNRETDLDRRDAEIKAREATIQAEARKAIAAREKSMREEITKELSVKQQVQIQERDRQIEDLSKRLRSEEELRAAEVERILFERESKIREEEKSKVERTYEPLRGKIKEYQQKEEQILRKEEVLKIREQEMELAIQRKIQQGTEAVRLQEKSRLEISYAPLRSKIEEYQKREADVLQREQTLALREQEISLSVAREVASRRDEFMETARRQSEEKHGIELKERERMIRDLQEQLEAAQRLIEAGSPQRRGLIQQEEIAVILARLFPEDEVVEISTGIRGADVLQTVRSSALGIAGSIYWESKRTKDFHPSWLPKLRQDQQEKKADIAALVTAVLPEGAEDFVIIDGVAVLHSRLLDPIASLMRQYLLNLARQRLTLAQREGKIHELHAYMTGKEFFQRVAAIVEAQARLAELNDKERKTHERVWSTRDQLHLSIGRAVAQLYGDIEGLVGALPPIEGLQLAEAPRELALDDKNHGSTASDEQDQS